MKKTVFLLIFSFIQLYAVGSLYGRMPGYFEEDYRPLKLKSYDATVKITDRVAVTTVEHIFKNETNQFLEGVFLFPLPDNAIVTDLTIWENGEPIAAEIVSSDSALTAYHKNIKKGISTSILEQLGNNVFQIKIFPIEPHGDPMSERKLAISFAEILPFYDGDINYQFAMKSLEEDQQEVENIAFSLTLHSQEEMKKISCSSHPEYQLTQPDNFNSSGELAFSNHRAQRDFKLTYSLTKDSFRATPLTYIPDGNEFNDPDDGSYFLLSITPPDSIAKKELLTKDIVFCADISNSMHSRLDYLKRAIINSLDHLREEDRFNIILFSSEVTAFKPGLTEVSSRSRFEAAEFINRVTASGLTNMEQALVQALNQEWRDKSAQTIIFLTDGVPTWPTTSSTASVLQKVSENINSQTAIYSFGLCDEVDSDFLYSLGNDNNGFATYIWNDDSIPAVMKQFMTQISYPLLTDLNISFGSDLVYETYPRELPNLYAGTELTVTGRFYSDKGTVKTTVTGSQKIRSQFELQSDLEFSRESNSSPTIARMWAADKIDHLFKEIDTNGESQDLKKQIQNLGISYSIVTRYTSFLKDDVVSIMDKSLSSLNSELSISTARSGDIRKFTINAPHSSPALLKVEIFDARGRVISTLMNEYSSGGTYIASFDNSSAAAGIYFVRVSHGSSAKITRFSVTK